jgi:hypothetical protein
LRCCSCSGEDRCRRIIAYHSRTAAIVTLIRNLWDAALGRPAPADFQPSHGNRRRVEIYDAFIEQAQARAEAAASGEERLNALKLIARLDARCKREVRRRELQTRP